MGFFSFRQQTVAACWGGSCISFLGALLVQVTAPATETAGRLLAVCTDVAELLAVTALRKTVLASICIPSACNVTEALQSEHFFGILPSSAKLLGREAALWLLIRRRVTDGWLPSA
jgi:hypothetical protein